MQQITVEAFAALVRSSSLRSVERMTANKATKNKTLPIKLQAEDWFLLTKKKSDT
jgi:hypothetical protein